MKGLNIISDFSKIQVLSNRNIFRTLKELQKGPLSGIQLAEKLGMKTPRVIYYLKQLEKIGLAKQIALKPVRGNREKFYCAVSQEFLISAGLEEIGESNSGMNASLSNMYLEFFLKRDLDLDLDEFVKVVLTDYLAIKPEEKVVIAFEEQNIGLYKKIIMHLRRIGAYYRTLIKGPDLEREMLMNLPEKEITIFYNGIAEMVDWADAWIDLRRSVISDTEGIPKSKLDFSEKERERAMGNLINKKDTRSVLMAIPRFEEDFHTDPDVLEKLTKFWKSVSVNSKEFSIVRKLADRIFDYASFSIHTGQNNVLNVCIDKTKYFIDAGPYSSSNNNNLFYLPSGEISFVPYLDDLSGSIYLDYCELHCTESKGILLHLENGIVTECRTENGDKQLEEYFRNSDLLERTVSQIGFGLNPAARSMSYIPRLDTKLFGSFHLTFGSNQVLGGDIVGYNTWDIIAEKPEVICNNEVILNDGVFNFI